MKVAERSYYLPLATCFVAPQNVYAKRWGHAGGHQASLPAALSSLTTITDRRKLRRALFELVHMFALSLPKAAVKQALRFVVLLILKPKPETEDGRELLEERRDVEVMPRPEPPLSRTPKIQQNAPNAI